MRILSNLMLWAVVLLSVHIANAQHLHLYKGPDGKPALAVYQGDADWLVEEGKPNHIHGLETVTALWLVQHAISVAEMSYVAELKQLRSLAIGQAPESVSISEPAFASLSRCVWLESVWICKENLTDSDLKTLQELPNLKSITIEGQDLCEASKPHGLTENAASILASMRNLRRVAIRGDAGFTDHSVEELAALPKLESLELRSKQFTNKALQTIASEMRLRELRIESPQFTDEAVQLLQQNTTIEELHIERGDAP